MLPISKMITLSTAHITEETNQLLSKAADNTITNFSITVYKKDEYGYFIYISDDTTNTLPSDLTDLIIFAKELDCEILCLDRDGEILPFLKKYDISIHAPICERLE